LDGSVEVGGDGVSGFVSAGGSAVGIGGAVSSCFTFLFALLFLPFFLALGKIQPHAEGIADSR
jgi:hypothetical protein